MLKSHGYLICYIFLGSFIFDNEFLVLPQIIIPIKSKLQYSPFYYKMDERILLTWTFFIKNSYKCLKLATFSYFCNKNRTTIPTTIKNKNHLFLFFVIFGIAFVLFFLVIEATKGIFSWLQLSDKTISYKSRSSHQSWSIKKGVLKNFAIFPGKHIHQSPFFNKVAGLQLY